MSGKLESCHIFCLFGQLLVTTVCHSTVSSKAAIKNISCYFTKCHLLTATQNKYTTHYTKNRLCVTSARLTVDKPFYTGVDTDRTRGRPVGLYRALLLLFLSPNLKCKKFATNFHNSTGTCSIWIISLFTICLFTCWTCCVKVHIKTVVKYIL